jgi:hypothetical protein
MTNYLKKCFFCLLTLCFVSLPALAEQSQDFGDYTVHYIAVNSSFISPEIAETYGIVRAPRNAFLNISVIKNTSASGTPVTASISGEKANFLSQNSDIDFIEVREGDAIYYIGQFEFSNAENLRFNLEVQPENTGPVYSLTWTTQLYIN